MKKLLLILLILIVLGGGAYWYVTRVTVVSQSAAVDTSGDASSSSSDVAPGTALQVYNSNMYHFSLLYSPDLAVSEYDDPGGHTTTFEGPSPGEGFQIFVVPYTASTITNERFKTDDPSGVMQDAQDIVVDGAPAKVFTGHNDTMGDTREVWFIKNGYLYEVTTYKALDTWLAGIMQDWKFI